MPSDATQMRRVALSGISADPDWAGTQTQPAGNFIIIQDVQDSGDFEIICVDGNGDAVSMGTLELTLQPILRREFRDPTANANRSFWSALDATKSTDITPYTSQVEDDIEAGMPMYARISAISGVAAAATHIEIWGRGMRNKASKK